MILGTVTVEIKGENDAQGIGWERERHWAKA